MILMKIVQMVSRMDVLGGAQIHVFDLTKGLIEHGHEVCVLAYGTGKLTNDLEALGIKYYELEYLKLTINPITDTLALFEVRKILHEIQPDIIALHSSKAGVIGRIVGRQLNIPTVFTSHSWSFSSANNFIKRTAYILIERLIGRLSTGIITVSKHDYTDGKKYKIANHIDMQLIHNGVHDVMQKNKSKIESTLINIVMVARFAYPKDHILLLNALTKVDYKNWQLTLIGDGPNLNDVKSYAKKSNLNHQIIFLGESRNVNEHLEKADLFILITKSEGLPLSIIEAMRAGLATIASNVGGIKELIDHNHTGFLVKRDDVEEITTAITTLLRDTHSRNQFGIEARKKYQREFTFTKMLQETEEYYEQVLLNHQSKIKEVMEG